MEFACAHALTLGVPAVAFTEHVDFTRWMKGDAIANSGAILEYPAYTAPLDVEGYFNSLQRCRDMFPDLKILSGIEAGEAHLFAESLSVVLRSGHFDRILGSLHALNYEGRLVQVETLYAFLDAAEVMRRYFTQLLSLITGSDVFAVLAHIDYPRRHWPSAAGPFDESLFEDEYRAVLRALASSGRVLEFNTLSPLASAKLIRWWHDSGGSAVSFGSDAHVPSRVGDRFGLAVTIVESAGFRPGDHPLDYWLR